MFSMISNILQNFFSRPATRRYPFVRRTPFADARGKLQIDISKCIFCGICTKRCPSDALKVDRATKTWTLDPYRCIICGYCMEACPKKCLSMDPKHGDFNA